MNFQISLINGYIMVIMTTKVIDVNLHVCVKYLLCVSGTNENFKNVKCWVKKGLNRLNFEDPIDNLVRISTSLFQPKLDTFAPHIAVRFN